MAIHCVAPRRYYCIIDRTYFHQTIDLHENATSWSKWKYHDWNKIAAICRRYFQMCFLEWKSLCFYSISLDSVPKRPVDKSRGSIDDKGDRSFLKPTLTHFTDVYIRHQTSVSSPCKVQSLYIWHQDLFNIRPADLHALNDDKPSVDTEITTELYTLRRYLLKNCDQMHKSRWDPVQSHGH